MSRTAPRCASRATASACNATLRQYAAATHHQHEGADPPSRARPATCRRGPTWWSTAGTTTACASLGPTCRRGSARPTPATTAMPTKPADWAAAAIERWHGPERKGFQTYAGAFQAAWADEPGRRRAARGGRVGRGHAGVRARRRPGRAGLPRVGLDHRPRPDRVSPIPIRWCASAPSTCSRPRRPAQIWPLAAPLLSDPSRGVRLRAVALLAAVPSGPPAARRPRPVRTRRRRVRRRPAAQRRPARVALRARHVLRPARPGRGGGGRISGGARG